jgi:Cytochrome c554 and c-prime
MFPSRQRTSWDQRPVLVASRPVREGVPGTPSLRRRAASPGLALVLAAGATIAVSLQAQMATADRIQDPGWWPTKGTPARAEYAGTFACNECHASHVAVQTTTSMARTLTAAATSETLGAHSRLSTTAGRYTFSIATTAEQSTYDVTDGTEAVSAPLKWAFGAGKVGQSFLFERDGVVREARVSYYEGAGTLDVTPGRAVDSPRTVTEAMGRVVGGAELRRCFGCHSTASAVRGSFEPDAALPGIACEACHGPGLRHAAAMRERRIVEGQGAILNPARLEPADSVDFCGACHATFWDVKLAGEKGIAAMRSQPYRLLSSKCWSGGDRRITCIACHNPHRPLVRDAGSYDTRCLACHAASGAVSASKAAACKVGSTQCVTCHMPKYEVREMHHAFTDHLIRVVR